MTNPGTGTWTEVGDRCFARRYPSYDVTVGVVAGEDGLLVVDTRAGPREAAELRADLAALSPRPVRWVVNTHWHFDHCFGNEAFAEAAIYGHESVPETLAERAASVRAELAAQSAEARAEMETLVLTPPARLFASLVAVDLGGRSVELVHPGRGHTGGDVVVRVPDADVLYAGDLVEESGPPAYGDDAFPLEWPAALDLLVVLLTPDTTVVPGHGAPVDQAFVIEQRDAIEEVAETIRQLTAEGVPLDDALARTTWPFPRDVLADAVRRGYQALGQ